MKIEDSIKSLKYCKMNEFSENLPNEIKISFSRFFSVENLELSTSCSIIVPKESGLALIDSKIQPKKEDTDKNTIISDFLCLFKEKFKEK